MAPAAVWYTGNPGAVPSQWDPLAPLELRAPETAVQRWKIGRALDDGAQCLAAVTAAGLHARPTDDVAASAHCGVATGVDLRRLDNARLSAMHTRCGVALSLFLWEREVVQPAARRLFGEPVRELLHFGSYSCRHIAGTRRWSQHARANAVDISGFRVASGRVVSVLRDWPGEGPAAQFLRAVRDGACGRFRLVLSPDFNAAHRDHFHFDHGYWTGCR
ncbi:MAG: extensin family protein [Pseudomonadota bacterium]